MSATRAAQCIECKTPLVDDLSLPPGQHTPCPVCGSVGRDITLCLNEEIKVMDFFIAKGKEPGRKKPYVELMAGTKMSGDGSGPVDYSRKIDRRDNEYYENVANHETGKLLHHDKGLLSDHTGHGSAKRKTPRSPKAP